MKLTPEKIVALKALAEDADISGIDSLTARLDLLHEKDAERIQVFKEYVPTLIADLEEAQSDRDHWKANHDNVVAKLRLFTQREDLPVDRLPAYEYVLELEKKLAETNNRERLISKNLDFERELHAKTEAELAATRKQLAESERRYSESVGGFKRDLQQKLDDQRSKNVRLKAKIAEAQALLKRLSPLMINAGYVGANAEIQRSLRDVRVDLVRLDTPALDAVIAEAIADEARNPWKQAIINELVVSHILHTDHETDPIKALAALVDYECKEALDPVVSKEAQELIEPYRKDAERYRWLTNDHDSPDTRKACHDISARIPVMSYSAASQAIDAAIAAKGDSE